MDKKIQNLTSRPNFHKIYSDLISRKYPENKEAYEILMNKEVLTNIDVINIDRIITGSMEKENVVFNQQHRSYDLNTIEYILSYQKVHRINNSKLAEHFNLSRNTVAKWIKLFNAK